MIDKKHCAGCRDNFYNGNNNLGVKECWMLKDAKLILRREVGMWERPPWTATPRKLPNCYSKKGAIFVKPDQSH